jgi:hypothetical protein
VDAALKHLDELIELMGDEKRKADIAEKLSKVKQQQQQQQQQKKRRLPCLCMCHKHSAQRRGMIIMAMFLSTLVCTCVWTIVSECLCDFFLFMVPCC